MKKIFLAIICLFGTIYVTAQDSVNEKPQLEYNRWSLELNGGVNKPQRPFATGYSTATPSAYNFDLGVRYMFNDKFGLKADIGYLNFQGGEKSLDFSTQYYRTSVQGVANLGRILNFENWTNTFGLLVHGGAGYAQSQTEGSKNTDRMGNFLGGITGQIKLSDKFALTGDFTTITNAKQSAGFDGTVVGSTRGFNGLLFTGTLGLTVYLGKNQKHADWYVVASEDKNKIADLEKKVSDIEIMMTDSDKDGVADYLDLERNTLNGVAVDTKGRAVDKNLNGVPDELESYLSKTYGAKDSAVNTKTDNELVKAFINEGYVTTYFDYNKSTPTNVSTNGIDFILMYLRNNPSASIDIIGHADELGRSEYNDKLATARATSVKNTLINAKIDASRLNVISAGEDSSVNKESDAARKLVRRVIFRIK